ncbi:GAF domain-containing protein [Chondromyces crocatus]|uniref:histidine kinase n=1 Tax=Chondromyces crocatus TaxID=52 RepID=A0A0K1EQP1_CHOCO|nr:GAF domain-containing protein [Chondromyces crocatus]AKT42972.1 uncharacterized protein CMC5_072000 [Chondromyces crocatus]
MLLRALRYSFAVVAATIAVGLAALAAEQFGLENGYFMIPLAAVMVVALSSGRGPALLTAALSGVGTTWAVMAPRLQLMLESRTDKAVCLMYVVLAAAMAHIGASAHESYTRVQAARVEADQALVRLRDLQSVTETALEDRPLPELLQELLARVARIFRADTAMVLLLDQDRESLVVAAAVGIPRSAWRSIRLSQGAGLAGQVFVSRRAWRAEELSEEEHRALDASSESRSAVGVPLLVEGRVLGVLDLGTSENRRFSDEDVALLELTAVRIARAVERVRLHEAADARARQQAAIAELGQRAIGGEPIASLMREVATAVAAALRVDLVSVLELASGGQELIRRAFVGGEMPIDPISAGVETQAGYALRHRGPVVVEDFREESRFQGAPCIQQMQIISSMCVTITGATQPFGVLGVYSRTKRIFNEDDVHFLEAVANVLSEAVRNHGAIAMAREAERQMERLYQEAMEAVRIREEFMSIASHELRTPLTPLSLQVGSLQRTLRNDPGRLSPERMLEKVDVVARQVARLHRLVGDLLDLSLLTAGNMKLRREEVDLASAARDAAHRFQEMLSRAGCELHLSVSGPAKGWWDRTRIDQVLTHLLSNAIKYGAGAPIDLLVEGDESAVRIVVRDRGIGIPVEQQTRIFGRFERAVSEHHYGGFGLGLWIVKQILDALGGTITVQSAPQQGSTFTVELPRRSTGTDAAAA